MASFDKVLLSESENGKGIAVAATATPGTLIHTSSSTNKDEVWLIASNTTSSNIDLTIEMGGVESSDLIVETIPAKSGSIPVVLGQIIQSGIEVRAFAPDPGINVFGYVNRI